MGGMKDLLGDTPYQLPTPPEQSAYDGATYKPKRDHGRLAQQSGAVFDAMKDGQWRTLAQIAAFADAPEPSVSARLRDMRKAKFGGHTVERKYVDRGLFQYRLIVRPT